MQLRHSQYTDTTSIKEQYIDTTSMNERMQSLSDEHFRIRSWRILKIGEVIIYVLLLTETSSTIETQCYQILEYSLLQEIEPKMCCRAVVVYQPFRTFVL